MELIKISNGELMITSKDVADNFGKTHQHVIDAIGSMDCSDEFRDTNFRASSYTSPQNKKLKCFDITRDGFSYLGMGFRGKRAAKWKEGYLKAFNKMESYIRNDMRDTTLMDSINMVSAQLDDLAAAGSAWGQTGHEIRRRKSDATEELVILLDKAQLQLGFSNGQ